MGISPGAPATDVLLTALKSPKDEERLAALTYLKQRPTDGIVKQVYDAMYGDDPELQEAAYLTLWEIGSSGYKLPHPTQFGYQLMLITNATFITGGSPGRLLPDHAVYISGDRIREVGPKLPSLKSFYPKTRRLDARGQFVMPGGICAHTHFYGAFSRGMAIPGASPQRLSGDP